MIRFRPSGGLRFRGGARLRLNSGQTGGAAIPDVAPPAPTLSVTTPTAASPVPLTGTAEAYATILVYVDGDLTTATVAGADGAWSANLTIAEGSFTLTAAAANAAGIGDPCAGVPLVVDRTAPAAPVIGAMTSPTNAANPIAVSGTAEANTVISLLDGGVEVALGASDGFGAWSIDVAFAEGSHTLTATATDAVGNTSAASAPLVLVVDRTAPDAPIITSPLDGSEAGGVSSLPVTFAGEAGCTGVVYDGLTPLDAVEGPAGTYTATVPVEIGEHTFTARLTDAAGNVGATSAAVTWTRSALIDTVISVLDPGRLVVASGGLPTFESVLPTGFANAGAETNITPTHEVSRPPFVADEWWTTSAGSTGGTKVTQTINGVNSSIQGARVWWLTCSARSAGYAVYERFCQAVLKETFDAADLGFTIRPLTINGTNYNAFLEILAYDAGDVMISDTTSGRSTAKLFGTYALGANCDLTSVACAGALNTNYALTLAGTKAWIEARLSAGKTWADVARLRVAWGARCDNTGSQVDCQYFIDAITPAKTS